VGIGSAIFALGLAVYLHIDNNVFKTVPEFKRDAATKQSVKDGDDFYGVTGEGPVYFKVEKEKTNLKELSKRHYKGSDSYALDIYDANKEKLGEKTPNDIVILKGTELIIPDIKLMDYQSPILISIVYVMAVLLAIGWKLYVIKMYELCLSALNNNSTAAENTILNLKDELEQSENDCRVLKEEVCRVLKEEVAIQIIEMNQLTGLNKES